MRPSSLASHRHTLARSPPSAPEGAAERRAVLEELASGIQPGPYDVPRLLARIAAHKESEALRAQLIHDGARRLLADRLLRSTERDWSGAREEATTGGLEDRSCTRAAGGAQDDARIER